MKSVGKKELMLARQTGAGFGSWGPREGGACLGQPEHTTMVKPCRMWTCTHMMMVREDDSQNGLDAGSPEHKE